MTGIDWNQVRERFKQGGYALTAQRRLVYEALAQSGRCHTPHTLQAELEHLGINLTTVYRALEVLGELELVEHVHSTAAGHGYAARSGSHVHQLVCQSCGRVIEFHHCDLGPLIRRLARKHHFKVEHHHLELHGVCEACDTPQLGQEGHQSEMVRGSTTAT
ncbi:MAG: transcriptional repressor [Deinococcus sp.]|nr:transcriptional repressor [Deinococcus sp.]